MNKFAINEALKPSRIGSLTMVCGALLGTMGALGPASGADLPYSYTPYRPSYYQNSYRYDYYNGSYGPVDVRVAPGYGAPPPLGERFSAAQPWPPYNYYDPRFPVGEPYGPNYSDRAYTSRYPYYPYYPGPMQADAYEDYEAAPPDGPRDEPRRRMGFGGFAYPPAPAAYQWPDRRAPYRYGAGPSYERREHRGPFQYRPDYEYETAERPPASVPGGNYYGPGYPE
ncbi:MAG: hypothetical protein J2P54_06055 [Bradyrhizobiaceae bacterium]|nr:hypothetical protein [Bradyrhizobiaceae bacterium]